MGTVKGLLTGALAALVLVTTAATAAEIVFRAATVSSISAMARIASSPELRIAAICCWMSEVAREVWLASCFTSCATTACRSWPCAM